MKHWPSVVFTTRAIVGLLLFAAIAVLSLQAVEASHERSLITIPTLGVLQEGDTRIGGPSYVVIQVDHLNQPVGPEVQFNQGSRVWGTLMGSAVGSEWREAARNATLAAARALREDPREWQVTLKEVSMAYFVDGPSASAALAVGMVAAKRGAALLPGVVLTGTIDAEGRISAVGALPEKIQGAAHAGFSTILIPPGQTRTRDWDLRPLSESLHVIILEVPTLKAAYEKMTGQSL